jgi:hypothetical protein
VEVDGTLCGLGLEVGGLAAQAERLGTVGHCALFSAQRVSVPARGGANNTNMRGGGVRGAASVP